MGGFSAIRPLSVAPFLGHNTRKELAVSLKKKRTGHEEGFPTLHSASFPSPVHHTLTGLPPVGGDICEMHNFYKPSFI